MSSEKEITLHKNFEKLFEGYLFSYSNKIPPFLRFLKIFYLLALIKTAEQISLVIILLEIRMRILRLLRYRNRKESIGFLVDSLDKGGMEQVVYNLVTEIATYNPYVYISGKDLGEKAWQLMKQGYYVYCLQDNFAKFVELTNLNQVKILNSHFSLWNFEGISSKGIKILYTIHSQYSWIEYPVAVTARISAYKYVDHFIAVSESVKKYFSRRFKIPVKRITVIENGIGYKELYLTRKETKGEDEFTFLNIGTITSLKNQILLLSAFKEIASKYKSVRLLLVGNTPDERYLNGVLNYIEKNNLQEIVTLSPFVGKDILSKMFSNSDCFVLSSLQEGCPNVLMESLYFGLPTISTSVGNAPELLKDYGIIIPNSYKKLEVMSLKSLLEIADSVDQENKQSLVVAMSNVIERKEFFCERATLAREYVVNSYNVGIMVGKYTMLIKQFC